ITGKGYKIVDRQDLITFFSNNVVDNDIYVDFVENINSLESSIKSFETLPIKNWDYYSWQGFYQFLDSQIKVVDWQYVSNPAGGFLGLWWHFIDWEGYKVYLQIEQDNFCFKIGPVEEKRSAVRNKWYSVLSKYIESKKMYEIKKPTRFGNGTYMTVGVVSREDWLGKDNAILDKDVVIRNLKKYEKFLSNCVRNSKRNVK
ncbi:MAG TPA: hypothetical protein PKN53_00815, partial [Bacteroidales bacterium]|nr:hypothetical protein [Bacteroidales bacterium]